MGRSNKGLLGSAKQTGGRMASKLKKEVKATKKDVQSSLKSDHLFVMALKTLGLVGFYFLTSIGLTFYQSSLLKKIHFPISIVSVHFILKFFLSYLTRLVYSLYTGVPRVYLGWSYFLGRVGLVALVASLDIGLSQWSFQYIQVALYTVTKSTSIIFILFFAILFGLEKKHWSLIVIVLMIGSGLTMFTYKSTDFNVIGFSMVLSASFLSGIRWTLSQSIMQRSNLGLSNPVDMIFHVQPVMIITLLPFVLGFEGPKILHILGNTKDYDLSAFTIDIAEVVAGGVLAFLMETSEFLLLSHTSSLTLSISGIIKEIITMSLAVVYQSTDLSIINMVGLGVCLLGISIHVLKKSTETEKSRRTDSYMSSRVPGEVSLPLLSDSDDSEEELYRGTRLASKRRSVQEEFFLKDNRTWTSVKDAHIEGLGTMQDITYKIQDSMEDGLPEGGEGDALEEADKLLEQLDLLSSD